MFLNLVFIVTPYKQQPFRCSPSCHEMLLAPIYCISVCALYWQLCLVPRNSKLFTHPTQELGFASLEETATMRCTSWKIEIKSTHPSPAVVAIWAHHHCFLGRRNLARGWIPIMSSPITFWLPVSLLYISTQSAPRACFSLWHAPFLFKDLI